VRSSDNAPIVAYGNSGDYTQICLDMQPVATGFGLLRVNLVFGDEQLNALGDMKAHG